MSSSPYWRAPSEPLNSESSSKTRHSSTIPIPVSSDTNSLNATEPESFWKRHRSLGLALRILLCVLVVGGVAVAIYALFNGFSSSNSSTQPSLVPLIIKQAAYGRASSMVDRILTCNYTANDGMFSGESVWQAANTLETLAHFGILAKQIGANVSKIVSILQNTYNVTEDIMCCCYDDQQWYLLAWARAYILTGNMNYLIRAAVIFNHTVTNAWTPYSSTCNGGVIWCPINPGQTPYKNAITNELFISSAMMLHPYASLLGVDKNYYLNWAETDLNWFFNSGMINNEALINDGLTDSCANNGQPTWTYNQGVFLDGAIKLALATNNLQILQQTVQIILGAIKYLPLPSGILQEAINAGLGDASMFKGAYMRHLSYSVELNSQFPNSNPLPLWDIASFILTNSYSVNNNAECPDNSFGMHWNGPCESLKDEDTATHTSALDLLIATMVAADELSKDITGTSQLVSTGALKTNPQGLVEFGLGNCQDNYNNSMPNCYNSYVTESVCRAHTLLDKYALGYDFNLECPATAGFCRIRTLGGPNTCAQGWQYENGPATNITATSGHSLTLCVIKEQQYLARLQ